MRIILSASIALSLASPAAANDWEKFYTAFGSSDGMIDATVDPEIVPSTGNVDRDLEAMWRRGFAATGYTYFSTRNSKTTDAKRFAKKLKARYFIAITELTSSETRSVPLTLPNTTTSYTSGTASAYGSRGYASGTYSGTTTTTGTSTAYFPMTVNRFDKVGIYFKEVPKIGAGIFLRDLTQDEIQTIETRRAFAIKFVRDNSPAYYADLLPGDIITQVNGQPADPAGWLAAIKTDIPLNITLIRNGRARQISLIIPEDWRPH